MKYNIKDKVSIDSEYLKNLNMHSRDGYDIFNKMFSQKVSCSEHVYCPECNSLNILVLKAQLKK